jgi:hypothetical protein
MSTVPTVPNGRALVLSLDPAPATWHTIDQLPLWYRYCMAANNVRKWDFDHSLGAVDERTTRHSWREGQRLRRDHQTAHSPFLCDDDG